MKTLNKLLNYIKQRLMNWLLADTRISIANLYDIMVGKDASVARIYPEIRKLFAIELDSRLINLSDIRSELDSLSDAVARLIDEDISTLVESLEQRMDTFESSKVLSTAIPATIHAEPLKPLHAVSRKN